MLCGTDGDLRLRIQAGNAVIFLRGDGHLMNSHPGRLPTKDGDLCKVLARRPRQRAYGGGATTRLVCGYLACNATLSSLLLDGLSPIVRVNVRGSNAGVWLQATATTTHEN